MKVFVNLRAAAATLHLCVSGSFSWGFAVKRKWWDKAAVCAWPGQLPSPLVLTVAPWKLRSEVKLFLSYVCVNPMVSLEGEGDSRLEKIA
jgi:predicted nucleotidyltransferase